jgi:Na+/proline symporter
LLVFAWRILERLVLLSAEHRIVSIGDFLCSRYGRAPGLSALVAIVALTAAVPYVALQFKAVAMSVDVLAPGSDDALFADPALYVAQLLAAFSILFGTRQIDATEHHRGMVLAVALESLIKLIAFVAIGAFALASAWRRRFVRAHRTGRAARGAHGMPAGFLAQTLLAFTAIVCLPRQFHVAVVECQDPADVRSARWLFGAYLMIFSVMVLPITLAGQSILGASGVSPDTYVLALPMAMDHQALALVAYIGGFSAATGMVIVASVALATMVSNDLAMPLLLRSGVLVGRGSIDQQVLWVRRVTIVALAPEWVSIDAAALLHELAAQYAPSACACACTRRRPQTDSLAGLRVLCVDNDPDILDGLRALLERWHVDAILAANVDDALAALDAQHAPLDVALVDYHLHDRLDGRGVIVELRRRVGCDIPAALLTGDGSDAVKNAARESGCIVLTKPVKPASLRAFLAAWR